MGRTRQENMQIQLRRTQVADLYLKGWKQAALARELGVCQASISNDLKAIRKEWMESRVRNSDEMIVKEAKKLEVVEREAWDGWQRSQEPAETTRIIQKNGEKSAEKTVRERTGDHGFLRVVISAIEKRLKLLGLDAAAKAALETPDEQVIRDRSQAFSWDSLYARMDSNLPEPEVIDDDYIERFIAGKIKKSRTKPLVEET